jgi:hypothetical protein
MLGGLLVAAVGCVDESQETESVENAGEALLIEQGQHSLRPEADADEVVLDRSPIDELRLEEIGPAAPGTNNTEPEPIPWNGPKPDPSDDDTYSGTPT